MIRMMGYLTTPTFLDFFNIKSMRYFYKNTPKQQKVCWTPHFLHPPLDPGPLEGNVLGERGPHRDSEVPWICVPSLLTPSQLRGRQQLP